MIPLDPALWALFVAGLFSGVHCGAMCGGIVSALALAGRPDLTKQLKSSPQIIPLRAISRVERSEKDTAHINNLTILLGYNLGRLSSYMLAGILAGWLGSGAFLLQKQLPLQQIAFVIANLLLITTGLYLAGAWRGLTSLEVLGRPLWDRIKRLLRYVMPIDSLPKAVLAGVVWGWLPCGLVYSALLMSLLSGSVWRGATLMLAWGLGTLPNLLMLGYAAQKASRWLAKRKVRLVAGGVIVFLGVFGLLRLNPLAHVPGLASFCLPGTQIPLFSR